MPQYLLSVWHDDDYDRRLLRAPTPSASSPRSAPSTRSSTSAGAWVFGAGLHPASSATVVRPTGDQVSMTDGPYAESKEQMGGFWVIEAADLDAALDWAAQAAAACEGPVEVRPIQGE